MKILRLESSCQAIYLLALSILGLWILHTTSNFVQESGWILPESGPHVLLLGIFTDLLIVLLPTAFLVVMAWLPRQLGGGIAVSFMLVLAILALERVLLVGALADYFSGDHDLPALWLAGRIKEFLLFGIFPFVLIEFFRRKLRALTVLSHD